MFSFVKFVFATEGPTFRNWEWKFRANMVGKSSASTEYRSLHHLTSTLAKFASDFLIYEKDLRRISTGVFKYPHPYTEDGIDNHIKRITALHAERLTETAIKTGAVLVCTYGPYQLWVISEVPNTYEYQYLNMLDSLRRTGVPGGAGQIYTTGVNLKINLADGFPALTTRPVNLQGVLFNRFNAKPVEWSDFLISHVNDDKSMPRKQFVNNDNAIYQGVLDLGINGNKCFNAHLHICSVREFDLADMIAEYALETELIAHTLNCSAGKLTVSIGYLYEFEKNIRLMDTQLGRIPYKLPYIALGRSKDITRYNQDDVRIVDYVNYPSLLTSKNLEAREHELYS